MKEEFLKWLDERCENRMEHYRDALRFGDTDRADMLYHQASGIAEIAGCIRNGETPLK